MNPFAVMSMLYLAGKAESPNRKAPPIIRKASKVPASPATVTNSAVKRDKALAEQAALTPEPWPVAIPSDMPPFPGPGWEPDVPARSEVKARAAQLISLLHVKQEPRIERTGGRWIAYMPRMHGSKKAVEAYRRTQVQPSAMRPRSTSDIPEPPRPPRPAAPAGPVARSPVSISKPARSSEAKPAAKPTGKSVPTSREDLKVALERERAKTERLERERAAKKKKEAERRKQREKDRAAQAERNAAKRERAERLEREHAARLATPASERPILRKGDKGEWVRLLQRNSALSSLEPDGIFGDRTDAAVRNFQARQRLPIDGDVGPLTWGRLMNPERLR